MSNSCCVGAEQDSGALRCRFCALVHMSSLHQPAVVLLKSTSVKLVVDGGSQVAFIRTNGYFSL